MRDQVAKIRRLLAEATPLDVPQYGPVAVHGHEPPADLHQSPRARSEREILRIAAWYNWGPEITRFLDAYSVISLCGLPIEGLNRLLDRMKQLEDCVQMGFDAPDAPPAR
jgi:hypothetical protein